MELEGKRIVVIGATSGIGEALARGLADAGAQVVVGGRRNDAIERVCDEVERRGAKAFPGRVDVTDESSLARLADDVKERFGGLDGLVNAAGIHLKKPALEVTAAEWDRVFETNARGVFLACRHLAPLMMESGGGSIVNVASMGSFVALSETAAYSASKAAVLQLTRSLAVEWADRGVRVNALAPGFFITPLNADILAEGTERRRRVEESTPLGRVGDVDELIGAVAFLLSDSSSFVTGTSITVDGGFLAKGI